MRDRPFRLVSDVLLSVGKVPDQVLTSGMSEEMTMADSALRPRL